MKKLLLIATLMLACLQAKTQDLRLMNQPVDSLEYGFKMEAHELLFMVKYPDKLERIVMKEGDVYFRIHEDGLVQFKEESYYFPPEFIEFFKSVLDNTVFKKEK